MNARWKHRRFGLWLWLPAALLAICARADTIRLKNGNVIEGIIEKETPNEIVLGVGVGSVTLARSRIASIERSDRQGRESIRSEWRRQYYAHERFLPDGLEDLAGRFEDLQRRQRTAQHARGEIDRLTRGRPAIHAELERVRREGASLAARLVNADPQRDVQAYNEIVSRHNAVNARAQILQQQLREDAGQIETHYRALSSYMNALRAFRPDFQARQSGARPKGMSEAEGLFFDRIAERLADCEREIDAIPLPNPDVSGHIVVEAVINGQGTARLLLDTGASVVTLSERAAQRLKLDLPDQPNLVLEMADGTKTSGRLIELTSVRVGDAEARSVRAAVIETKPGEQFDGLLGMTFLREFSLRMDSAGGHFVLERFAPDGDRSRGSDGAKDGDQNR